jgi:hypothetical protein
METIKLFYDEPCAAGRALKDGCIIEWVRSQKEFATPPERCLHRQIDSARI